MSTQPGPAAPTAARVPPPTTAHIDGIAGVASIEDPVERRLDEIEMIGEEEAAGFTPTHSPITPGMRYLHCSRTIHQLVTDRNRAVGLYLAVASLLWTASSALMNARPSEGFGYAHLIVPLTTIQRWCLPATFGTLAVLAAFAGLLLTRTRIGLIYEVAKMNVLLGLPVGRVQRVNLLSIFFIMHALISLAGGCSAALFAGFILKWEGYSRAANLVLSGLVGLVIVMVLVFLYIGTVLHTTADDKLRGLRR